jgi:ABC-type transporter Mla maintaining outer membrane lipid asymmetry permease subunit MlaE
LYAIGVVAFAALVGAVTAAQMAFGLRKFGGYEHVMPVVALSTVRSLAPAVTGSALLVAFVVWAHRLRPAQLQAELPRLLKRALLVSLPGYLVASAIAIGAGLLVCWLGLGVSAQTARLALSHVTPSDWAVGALSTLCDAGLIVFLAWRYLARLQADGASLPMKLVLAWTFGSGLRMTLGLLVSLLLPA